MVNRVLRLALLEGDGYAAGFMRRVDLQKTGVGRQRVKQVHGFAAQVIPTNAAQNRGSDCPAGQPSPLKFAGAPPRRGPSGNMSHNNSPIPRIKCGSFKVVLLRVPGRDCGVSDGSAFSSQTAFPAHRTSSTLRGRFVNPFYGLTSTRPSARWNSPRNWLRHIHHQAGWP